MKSSSRSTPERAAQWQDRLRELARSDGMRIALAALSSWLAGLGAGELPGAVAEPPRSDLSDVHANYVAAMI